MSQYALAPVANNGDLIQYMKEINRFPFLSAVEEFQLAARYYHDQDREAAHRLVTSYLRYVVKIAREYDHYGLRIMDLIQEGSLGLMQAVKKFNPYKGVRLATYGVWWIRASIQEFILRSWSLVKIGTTTAQRKLFFNLRKNKQSIERLDHQQACEMGQKLGVSTREVLEMDGRLSGGDDSLNRPSETSGDEIQSLVPDTRANQEIQLLESERESLKRLALTTAMNALTARERFIIARRFLAEKRETLEEIAGQLAISRERVRQLEKQCLKRMKTALENANLQSGILVQS